MDVHAVHLYGGKTRISLFFKDECDKMLKTRGYFIDKCYQYALHFIA